MKMEEGWVWFRGPLHKEPRVGYLVVSEHKASLVVVPHKLRPNVVVFRYAVKDLLLLEPLPAKIQFKMRLKDELPDFEYKE